MASAQTANNAEKVVYLRASELAASEKTGVILTGVYLGTVRNERFGRDDFKFRAADGAITVVNAVASLAKGMAGIGIGDMVEISYNGAEKITSGKLKGKSRHLMSVTLKN